MDQETGEPLGAASEELLTSGEASSPLRSPGGSDDRPASASGAVARVVPRSEKIKVQCKIKIMTTTDFHATVKIGDFHTLKLPAPPAKWNNDVARWETFETALAYWHSKYVPPQDINIVRENFSEAVSFSAMISWPVVKVPHKNFKDFWYIDDEVNEHKEVLKTMKESYRQDKRKEFRQRLTKIMRKTQQDIVRIRKIKWMEWLLGLNKHSSFADVWVKLSASVPKESPALPTSEVPEDEDQLSENSDEECASLPNAMDDLVV